MVAKTTKPKQTIGACEHVHQCLTHERKQLQSMKMNAAGTRDCALSRSYIGIGLHTMTTPTPLTTLFPPRMKNAPPKAGGFYGYNKNLRTVGTDNDIESNSTLLIGRERIKPAAGNYRQFFRSQMVPGEQKAELNINEDDDLYEEYEEEEVEYKHFDKARVAPGLVSSFSAVLPATKVRSTDAKREETQTRFVLPRQKFETLPDYQIWIQSQVDPFIADLRRAILNERPVDINEYVMAYTLSMSVNAPAPSTIDEKLIPVEKTLYPSQNPASRNEEGKDGEEKR